MQDFVVDSRGTFRRCFLATSAAINAFKFARPVIGVDGTHMTSEFKGILLIACCKDGLDRIVPLAYAYVHVENADNWTWFLGLVKSAFHESLAHHRLPNIVIISDRQKGLLNAVGSVFPSSHHALCVIHLVENVKRMFGSKVSEKIWLIAKSKSIAQYDRLLDVVGKLNPEAKAYLAAIEKAEWVDAFFPGRRFGYYTSNICESINAHI